MQGAGKAVVGLLQCFCDRAITDSSVTFNVSATVTRRGSC